ncbi:protein of unknown function [Streptantibioticus cattleyicolor NRRL 8057 = DSM 46488]|nr:protein of unknown function [Streptantibioticus cattleyicolor NRRL 8057 = DSM 46488]
MAQHGEPVGAQRPVAPLLQQGVGEQVAGEDDRGHPVGLPYPPAGGAHRVGHRVVEAGGDGGGGGAGAQVGDEGTQHRRRVEHAVRAVPEGVGVVALVGHGGQRARLQHGGRVAVVGAEPEEGGDRVEEQSHAGGGDLAGVRRVRFVRRLVRRARQPGFPGQAGRPQMGEGRPVRGRAVPARGGRQRQVGQVGRPPVPVVVREQHLAAPQRAVVAVAAAVEDDTDHRRRAVEARVGHGGGHVRVVVLDEVERAPLGVLPGPARRQVAGVPVGGEDPRPYPGQRGQVVQRAGERGGGGRPRQVAEVRGEPGGTPLGEAERGVVRPADGQRGRHRVGQLDRLGHVTARPAQRLRLAVRAYAYHRVVAGHPDAAVVPQPGVGDAVEPVAGLGVVGDGWFAGPVAAGDHQQPGAGRVTGEPEEQVVQRGVGQRDADVGAAGADGVGRGGALAGSGAGDGGAAQQHDGVAGVAEQGAFLLPGRGEGGGGLQVGGHHGERPGAVPLPAPQGGHGALVGGVADQLVAAEALDREDRPGGQQPAGLGERLVAVERCRTARRGEVERGSAVGAGHRLGVEPPVRGVGVLGGAPPAHRERRHRGGGAVVGQRGDDGEPRAAVRAGDEGVAVAPVAGGGQLGQAGGARRGVGGDEGASGALLGGADGEVGAAERGDPHVGDGVDDGAGRGVGADAAAEHVHPSGVALHLGDDPAGVVDDVPGQPQLTGEPVHERAEPHPLHDPPHHDPVPNGPLVPGGG